MLIVEEGTWYYHESSVEKKLLSVYEKLAKANERVKELEDFQVEVAYRCFIAGLNTLKPIEPKEYNLTATAIRHFEVEVDRYARGASIGILEQLRKEQE